MKKTGYDAIVARGAREFLAGRYRRASERFALAAELARDSGDHNEQLKLSYFHAISCNASGDHVEALSLFTAFVSLTEEYGILSLSDEVVSLVARSYADWASCAAKVTGLGQGDYDEFFRTGERLVAAPDFSQYRSEVLHATAIACQTLRLFDRALISAEEGLALRRLSPNAPGCKIDHHLTIYSSLLVHFGRLKEARGALDEAIDRRPEKADVWEDRARLNWLEHDLDGALRDLNEAMFLEDRADIRRLRGLVREILGDRASAITDMSRSRELDKDDVYTVFWSRYLGSRVRGPNDPNEDNPWDASIIRFARGEITDKELLLAVDESTSVMTSRRNCDAHTLIGALAERAGDITKALFHYNSAVETKEYLNEEYLWSASRLLSLNARA